MANTKSAEKNARQAVRRAVANRARQSRVRTFIKNVEEAIASGDKEKAKAALGAATPVLMRSATKGVLHRNTVSRKISRLSARIKSLSAKG